MQHCIGLSQVEACAPRLEADEEQGNRFMTKTQYGLLAGLGGAAPVQIAVVPFFELDAGSQQAQQIDELTEHQHPVPAIDGFLQERHGLVQLAAGL